MSRPWNVNIHYDRTLDRLVSATAHTVLDVGCGDGFLAARLARRVPQVVALDIDEGVLARARARFPDVPVVWRHGDVLADAVTPGTFDAVVCNATLHHLPDTRIGLRRLKDLARADGTVAIVTFVRTERRDLPWVAIAFLARGVALRIRGNWAHSAPMVWPPAHTLRELKGLVATELPGSRVSRLMLGRVLIRWPARR